MAMTATITTTPSTAVTEQVVTAVLTISNSSSSPVSLLTVNPVTTLTSGAVNNINSNASRGVVSFGPNSNPVVNGSSSLVITFPVKFHAPSTGILGTGSGTYTVSALCTSDDGSVFSPTPATVTVNYAITYPAAQQ